MIQLLALALCCAGFAGFALAMDRHHRQVWHCAVSSRRRALLRTAGTVGLGLALAVSVTHSGWGTGTVLWLGLSSMAVPAVALMLTYRPRLFVSVTGSSPASDHKI